MTFRKLMGEKKFGKNGSHTLQGTMFHNPLTNTSSFKITAAYCRGQEHACYRSHRSACRGPWVVNRGRESVIRGHEHISRGRKNENRDLRVTIEIAARVQIEAVIVL
jgi:hypothetical protein